MWTRLFGPTHYWSSHNHESLHSGSCWAYTFTTWFRCCSVDSNTARSSRRANSLDWRVTGAEISIVLKTALPPPLKLTNLHCPTSCLHPQAALAYARPQGKAQTTLYASLSSSVHVERPCSRHFSQNEREHNMHTKWKNEKERKEGRKEERKEGKNPS